MVETGEIGPRLHALEPAALVGSILDGRYRLERVLGEGGMGAVFLAEHLVLRELRAVKILSPRFAFDPEWVSRFRLEAKAGLRIDNEHVVRVLDLAAPAAGFLYMVMEFVQGENLAEFSRREGPVPWPRALSMGDQIASALEKAHSQGIIHRDIKLGNCIRTTVGEDTDHIKVLDFGIAKFLDNAAESIEAPRTATDVWMGTAEYMAPELFRGQADARVDVYALGILIFKLLTGRTPFPGGHMEVSTQLLLRDPDPPSRVAPPGISIPPEVDQFILRAIARERADRIPSMVILRAELRALLSNTRSHEVREGDTTLVRGGRKAPSALKSQPETVTATTLRPDAAAAQATAVIATGPSVGRGGYKVLTVWLISVFLVSVLWFLLSDRYLQFPAEVAEDQAEFQGPPIPAATDQAEPPPIPEPVVAVPDPGTSLRTEPELTASGDSGAAGDGVSGDIVGPIDAAPPPASRKPSPRRKPLPKKPKAEDPWQRSLEAELKALEPNIQKTCFEGQVPRGTAIVLDIEVGATGRAKSSAVSPKFLYASDCIRFIVKSHVFSLGSRGGAIRQRFVAR